MAISLVDNTTGAGEPLNTGFDKVNSAITRLNQLDALSVGDIAQLDIYAGVPLTSVELNILDGATLTTAELNRLDGTLAEVRTNLGLTDASASLDVNSLAINSDDIFDLFYLKSTVDGIVDLLVPKARTLQFTTDDALTFDTETAVNLTANRAFALSIEDHGLGQRGVITTGAQSIYGAKTLEADLTAKASILSDDYVASNGVFANGIGHKLDNAGNLEVQSLKVNGALSVEEFIAKQITAIGVQEILSVGTAKVAESVSTTTDGGGNLESEVIRVESLSNSDLATSFVVGDLVAFAQIDINNPSSLRRVEYRVVNETSATVGSTLNADEVELVPDTNYHGSPATTANALQVSDFLVIYGNIGASSNVLAYTGLGDARVGTNGRDSIIKRSVLGNPLVTLQSGVNTYAKGFGASVSDTVNLAYGDLDGLVTGISTTEIGMIIGDPTLAGNHVLLTDTQGAMKFNKFSLTAGGLNIDSTVGKKIKVTRSTEEIINIGDFDNATYVEDLTTETATASSSVTPATSATTTNNSTTMNVPLGTCNLTRPANGLIAQLERTYDVLGKWTRIQFDWVAGGYDATGTLELAMGYEIDYPLGEIKELSRDSLDSTDSGSVDTGYVFIPLGADPDIRIQMLAPAGGINSGDAHANLQISNLVVTTVDDDFVYTDISNDGFRTYKAGGRNLMDFSGSNAKANFKDLEIGLWNFKEASNGDLNLSYGSTVVQTFTKP